MRTPVDESDTSDREIVLKRVLDAPRELVYDAFFDRENIGRWWGPNGFSTTTKAMDVRVGGVWEYVMHGPDGTDYPNRVVYTKLDRPNGFAYDHGTSAAEPRLFATSVRLVELSGGRTEVTLKSVWDTQEERDLMEQKYGAREGGEQMLERLAEELAANPAADRQVFIERLFDAPRERVFQAWSDPAILERWYAPHGCTILIHEYDFRERGAIRTEIRTPDGYACRCRGTFGRIVAPERIVFDLGIVNEQGEPVEPASVGMDPDWPQSTTIDVSFEEQGNRTRLTLRQNVSEALAKRTGAYPSWLQMFERLDGELAAG